MSMMVYIDDIGFMSFGKYLISESIIPKEVKYGINSTLDNGEWIKYHILTGNYFISTFTYIEGNYYMVSIAEDGEIFFSTCIDDKIDITRLDDPKYINRHFTTDRVKTRQIIMVLNRLIYIFLKGIDKVKPKNIKFSAADPSLGTAYSFIMDNKFVVKMLSDKGYKYKGRDDNYFMFDVDR